MPHLALPSCHTSALSSLISHLTSPLQPPHRALQRLLDTLLPPLRHPLHLLVRLDQLVLDDHPLLLPGVELLLRVAARVAHLRGGLLGRLLRFLSGLRARLGGGGRDRDREVEGVGGVGGSRCEAVGGGLQGGVDGFEVLEEG